MNQQEINSYYKQFNVPVDKVPTYSNPTKFAQQYERCSLLEYNNTSYSNTSSIISKECYINA